MTEGYLNEYIRERMLEKSVHAYHWEPVTISVLANEPLQLGAFNESYFLVTRTLADGTVITGDNHYLVARDYANLTFARLHEFSGNISIESPINTTIEFIRVIPES